MAWFIRFMMLAVVIGACAAGWSAAGMVTGSVAISDGDRVSRERNPSSVVGPALQSRMNEALGSINAQRDTRKDAGLGRVIFLERVSFERSAGGVVARGSIVDFGQPRRVSAVVDAFDGTRGYLQSASSVITTSQGSIPFSVFMEDRDDFQSFSVRFLDEKMEEIVMRSADAPVRKVPPLLMDDPVHAADMGEVASRLVSLGYAEKAGPVRDEIVAAALIDRFRADVGISGPSGVTIGDLLALRIAGGPAPDSVADLSGY